MHRRQFLTAAAAGLAAAPLARAAGADDKPIEWRMVTSWPRNAPGVGVNAQRVADLIGALSGGRLTVKLFAAAELVPPFEVMDAVGRGTAEMGHTALYYGVGKSPALHFFTTIPYGLTALELSAWLEFGGGNALKDEILAPFGIRSFYAGNSGVQAMGWFREPIESVADLKGLKMRIAGLGGQALAKLGVTPVLMPPGEIYQALSGGVVDAAEWVGPWNDLAFGLQKVAKHYYLPAFHEPGPSLDAMVNLEAYNALPADLQAIVASACQAVALTANADFLYHNIDALQVLIDEHDVTVHTLPDDVVEALGPASREVIDTVMAEDETAARVGESYMAFVRKAVPYQARMDAELLAQRAKVWG